MRWPCRGDTGKLISPCSDGATCSRSFLRFDHEKRHHDKQQECGDQSIFERHGAYPSRKHSWARRCAAPALAGCAHAVSGHVAAVHIGSFLRRGNPDPRMSLVGQNPNLPRRNSNGRFPSTSRHPSGQICAGSAPSRCYRAGRSAAPTRLHPHSALPSLPPCRCVRVPCRRALSRRASPQPPRSRLPASRGCNEIKHDGFRVIARKNGQRVKLYSRPGNDLMLRFPLIVEALARLRPRSCRRRCCGR